MSPKSPKSKLEFLNISVIDKNMKKIFKDQFLARGKEIVFKANIVLLIQYKIKIWFCIINLLLAGDCHGLTSWTGIEQIEGIR